VTGNEYGDAVGRAGRRGGAHGPRRIDALCQLRVADHPTFGNAEQEAPRADLKRRAAQVQRQVGPRRVAGEVRFEAGQPGAEFGRVRVAGRHQGRARKFGAQLRE
jgi:hypothetical protein